MLGGFRPALCLPVCQELLQASNHRAIVIPPAYLLFKNTVQDLAAVARFGAGHGTSFKGKQVWVVRLAAVDDLDLK